jgi:hypothetical protein
LTWFLRGVFLFWPCEGSKCGSSLAREAYHRRLALKIFSAFKPLYPSVL